ncbi:DUF4192 domain-containing protein [Streptomyces tubbatahanensis]|uniref:DUF4192 domain-containing protein n=1 Tax=Streptomyces tubbatahanensis TaxID=2923272 RepID=A0ABY3XYQ3_9ACTN|nr:DUF4192 domain-containing protein [Streptomyces tubbatahanensis]UNS99398.1 DUF4192 domain-containing protein [Streptomyces tubbatahanensis]
MTHHDHAEQGDEPTTSASGKLSVSLREPAELAEALPYLLGFYPDDSLVVVALHGERGRFGGRLRIGIPDTEGGRAALAPLVAECLDASCKARGARPDGALVFLCQEPGEGHSGRDVMERLRPLVQDLRLACGERDMPVYEALCLSEGRWYSYCCPSQRCCPPEGVPLARTGTSVMAVAAAYAGMPMHGSLREMEQRLIPLGSPFADEQKRTLDAASLRLTPRMLKDDDRERVRTETLALLGHLMQRFQRCTPSVATWTSEDAHDDGLLGHDECAAAILGLQDRDTRDQAAEWMEGVDSAPAVRLWRALARRCTGPYRIYSAPLLTLAGWVAWAGGDVPTARVALGLALRTDPDYLFAQLLHQACNEGLDPGEVRRCLRGERPGLREGREGGEPDPPADATS